MKRLESTDEFNRAEIRVALGGRTMPKTKNDRELREAASAFALEYRSMQERANAMFKGRVAEFVSPTFNGQPHGQSRPPLTGERVMIEGVFLDWREGVTFCAYRTESGKPINDGFTLRDVKFLDEVPQVDPKREAYLRKRCTCGAGMADGCCATCWPT